jgi:mono/diheme cytochrome c family protein
LNNWACFAFSIFWIAGCSQGPLGLDWGHANNIQGGNSTQSLGNPYESQAIAILQANCTSCHTSTTGPSNVYDLTDVGHLVSSGLIVPGQPGQSQLYNAISTGAMPPGGALPAADVTVIEEWIATNGGAVTPTPTPSPPTTPPAVQDTFSNIEATILKTNCTGCHSSSSAAAGYALDSYAGVMKAVNTSSPTSSLIYKETSKGAMPPSGSLSSAQISLILQWIQSGAPNN